MEDFLNILFDLFVWAGIAVVLFITFCVALLLKNSKRSALPPDEKEERSIERKHR
ncbi:hypothetical protein [Jeotgalibacillus soli]|nr:hypothetical protein [Jeotgalibacillus soli]